jgi:hypothetical protein
MSVPGASMFWKIISRALDHEPILRAHPIKGAIAI